ncbi:MAG: VENN motif pre-toxin domain-containing protein [Gilliamella sp.]|uniref:VENN motif pre-toxin domain-containing protein n=1 Tax=Gilliamella sp. TaxID=1891236 RepID=UPI0026146884|nr:VENN motif pre-toxin domain-containing protein [Gilliamella sp.]MCO6551423.1 VENN motif pre-toxin domain-containing protein [Gilliamella sp.]
MNQGMSAMGSDTRQGIDMAVSIINGLISGDMTGAAAGALAPKIATIIKQQTEGNTVANTVSHAILGAVVAELQGNSALVGGLGAAASERGAEVIMGILYPGKTVAELSQEERQQISALTQLATGLAIAAAGGDIQDVNTGVAAGKNAVENNYLNVVAKGASQLIKQGGKVCVKNTVCRTWATEQLIYAAATVGISLEVSDIDPDQLANIIDNINDNINLSLGPVGYSDFLTDKLVDYVLNNNKKPVDSSSASNNIAGSGSVSAGGAPGLPPDDNDKDRKFKSPKPGVSGKEGAKDVPGWAKEYRPYVGENEKQFAKRIMDKKYGKGNYDTKTNTEFSKIKKWCDRAFMDPK